MSATPTADLAGTSFKPIALQDLYIMHYRKGQNVFPLSKTFVCKGQNPDPKKNLMKAIEMSRDHCERITARFVRCVPFISDLAIDEQEHQEKEG
jgi:hypothetical protein